jgi:hypothetical protein
MTFTQLDIGGPVAALSLDHPGGNRINFDMRVELKQDEALWCLDANLQHRGCADGPAQRRRCDQREQALPRGNLRRNVKLAA